MTGVAIGVAGQTARVGALIPTPASPELAMGETITSWLGAVGALGLFGVGCTPWDCFRNRRVIMESSEVQIKSGLFSSWGLAAVTCAVGEIILISLQRHFGSSFQSFSFWYIPFAFTAPMVAGMGAIKKLRKKTYEPAGLAELSHELGILVSTANMTTVICIAPFILRGDH